MTQGSYYDAIPARGNGRPAQNAWFNAPCLYWPARAHRPVQVAADGSGNAIRSALLIDETLDAATPFPGSLEVRKLFPHSVLLAEPGGTTHADSLFGNLPAGASRVLRPAWDGTWNWTRVRRWEPAAGAPAALTGT